jgi:hypothetical protein
MIRALRRSCLLLIFIQLLPAQDLAREKPGTDTYGDPLPQGVVMRMGTVRLRHPDAAIAFSPDGKTLISAGSSGDVRYWETATGKEIRRVQLQRTGKKDAHIRGHKLSANGKVFGCWEQGEDTFAVYDAETGKQLRSLVENILRHVGEAGSFRLVLAPTRARIRELNCQAWPTTSLFRTSQHPCLSFVCAQARMLQWLNIKCQRSCGRRRLANCTISVEECKKGLTLSMEELRRGRHGARELNSRG